MAYFVPQLQQGLEENMVLVVMRDQHVIDHLRQIQVGIPRDVALVGIAQHRIKQHVYAAGFNQNACMPEVTPAYAFPGVDSYMNAEAPE